MPTLSEIADDHQKRRTALTDRATIKAVRRYRTIPVSQLDAGWDVVAPLLVAEVAQAQVSAARQASPYVTAAAAAQGSAERASLIPESFGGVMGDGREIGPAMFGAVTTAKTLIGRGVEPVAAFHRSAAFLATVVGAAIQDVGRQADSTLAVGRGFTRYIRVVSPGACSRCAVLAGSDQFTHPFLRHPRCRCTQMPISGHTTPEGFFTTPGDYFDSLTPAEQDRVFTKGGAEAIRSGADPIRVVNARRGADGISTSAGIGRNTVPNSGRRIIRSQIGVRPDGTPVMGVLTSEGTYRGEFRRVQNRIGVGARRLDGNRYTSSGRARLMPETIMTLADDLPTRQLLLRDAGYLEHTIADTSTNAWIAERVSAQVADRAAADRFYQSLGINLG